jgi:hypothetical protein
MDNRQCGYDCSDDGGDWLADDPLTPLSPSKAAINEIFNILRMDDDLSDDDDDDRAESGDGDYGYNRSTQQRRDEVERVRVLLSSGVVSPNMRSRHHSTSLLYHALIYDHRHPPEMIRAIVEAGADVNAPIHLVEEEELAPSAVHYGASAGERPLDCELWLELDGPYVAVNREKRNFLITHGATRSPQGIAAAAAETALAASAAATRAAEAAAREMALDHRLEQARHEWTTGRVPMWE